MTIALILNRGDKVKDVLLDSIKLKKNEHLIADKIEEALSIDQESKRDSDELKKSE